MKIAHEGVNLLAASRVRNLVGLETMITCNENNLRSNFTTLLVIVEFASWLKCGVGDDSAIVITGDLNNLSKKQRRA